ncbi:MAG: hypothetical protein K5910_04590 [Bacteroidales bacterium]|nr:hypothetical protein [Bacteroidales bacterium]
MKKFSILLLLLCALSFNACAQWYLFPGKKKENSQKTDTVRRTRSDSTLVLHPASDSLTAARPDSLSVPDPDGLDAPYQLEVPSVVHIGLILPLQASGKASENFLDLYSGALLALRDLGSAGTRMELQVFDSAEGTVPQTLLEDSDLIIGPVSADDITKTLPLCRKGSVLVSPLDPKAAEFADSQPVVQAPSPWTAQIDELVAWVREERPLTEDIYVIRDTAGVVVGEQSAYLINQLQEHGIRYKSVLSVREVPFTRSRQTRVMIASDRDSFITSTVRSLSIEGARNGDVILYATSRVRTNGTGPSDLHNVNAHLTAAYHIDYDDPAVKRFILSYRALFQNEPGSFSFQGYDAMHYFATMCAKYGKQWYKKLPDYSEKGLQSDFRFTRQHGRVNQAVRRIVYNPDLSTKLVN